MNEVSRATIYQMTSHRMQNEDHIEYISYGIHVSVFEHGITIQSDEIADISSDPNFVENLTLKCNTTCLPIEHFRDIVYDAVSERFLIK